MESLKEVYKIGRGPSSSHSMGPEWAARDFLKRFPQAEKFRVELYGSLALTGKGHLTDEAVLSALRGRDAEVVFDPKKKGLAHPNAMCFFAYGKEGLLGSVNYLSVGGGTVLAEGEERVVQNVYPFRNFGEWREYCDIEGVSLAEAVYRFEGDGIKVYLKKVLDAMFAAIGRGLNTEGVLPGDLKVLRKAKMLSESTAGESPEMREKRVISSYAFATAEENAGGGVIVTAPTCGASGVLPAVLRYIFERETLSEERLLDGLAVAGMVGNVVRTNASVSGAEAGCQAEIGTATAMAAAAVCSMMGANSEETEYAAEIALEHQLGLTCDPVHGYVQIPCIERNAVAALRALDSAGIARVLKGTRRISFDLIVKTMYEPGKDINARYRETSKGGLAANFNKVS